MLYQRHFNLFFKTKMMLPESPTYLPRYPTKISMLSIYRNEAILSLKGQIFASVSHSFLKYYHGNCSCKK